MELRHILKQLIKQHGISIKFLAETTTVPVQTIHNWMNGTEPRNLKQLKKIADHFEVSLDYICFGIEPQRKEVMQEYSDEINAGTFEVILRKIKN